MTLSDFVEATVAGSLTSPHPWHWLIIAGKWVYLHLLVGAFAIIVRMMSK
jgi:hypothetical protein